MSVMVSHWAHATLILWWAKTLVTDHQELWNSTSWAVFKLSYIQHVQLKINVPELPYSGYRCWVSATVWTSAINWTRLPPPLSHRDFFWQSWDAFGRASAQNPKVVEDHFGNIFHQLKGVWDVIQLPFGRVLHMVHDIPQRAIMEFLYSSEICFSPTAQLFNAKT